MRSGAEKFSPDERAKPSDDKPAVGASFARRAGKFFVEKRSWKTDNKWLI